MLASQLKPVNQAEMAQLFSGGGGGDASTVGPIKSRVGNARAMNKAFNIGHTGGSSSNDGVGGILGGLYDPSVAAADRGRAVLASSASAPSDTTRSTTKRDGCRGGGSLFDQSNPAELEGLDWKQLQKKMARKGKKTSKKTNKTSKKTSGTAPSSSSSPTKARFNAQQFERDWRRSCTDAPSTARYLLRTENLDDDGAVQDDSVQTSPSVRSKRRLVLRPEEASRTVFKVELGSDIMGDILAALAHLCRLASVSLPSSLGDDGLAADTEGGISNNDGVSFRPSFVYRWMIAMTKCGRFDLNVSFLTGEQKQDVEQIVATLEKSVDESRCDDDATDCDDDDDDDDDDDGRGGGFTEEDVMRVRELYK